MKQEDMGAILRKVEELRALLVFSQRTLPFLEDVFSFVTEIVPLLDVLKSSVESTSEKLPRASHQLNKVTTATEMASTEILNIVEAIAARTDGLRASLDGRKDAVEGLLRGVQDFPESARGTAAFYALEAGLRELLPAPELYTELEVMQNDCTNIMIALQVQDITAQQIASVNQLMQSVDEGLNRLLKNFHRNARHDATQFKHQKLNIVFDTSAEYTGSPDRQRMADALIAQADRSGSPKHAKPKRAAKKR